MGGESRYGDGMRWIGHALLTVCSAALLTGCAAALTPPNSEKVQQWMARADAPDVEGTRMVGLASTTEAVETAAEAGRSEGVRVEFDEPTPVGALVVSCFGVETMQVSVQLISPSAGSAGAELSVTCADAPAVIDMPSLDKTASAIVVNGYNEHGFGAWAARVD